MVELEPHPPENEDNYCGGHGDGPVDPKAGLTTEEEVLASQSKSGIAKKACKSYNVLSSSIEVEGRMEDLQLRMFQAGRTS